jgi:hypothetical protein
MSKPFTAYLAARYTRRLELCDYRDQLYQRGIDVPARWLNGGHQLDGKGRPITEQGELQFENGDPRVDHLRKRFARDDYDDVTNADVLIAFTEEPRGDASGASRGGRHVELGIAIGQRKPVYIVGPRENIFCWLYPDVLQSDTWTDFCLQRLPFLDGMHNHK